MEENKSEKMGFYNNLYQVLLDKGIMSKNQCGAWVYALHDIDESIGEVYTKIVPKLLDEKLTKEQIQELMWDIREEFRHIQYHIDDAKLTR